MFAKDFSLILLFDRYAALLTEKQQTAFSLYYNEDFSLAEIAEHTGTSRQAVRSLLQKTEQELHRFEDALHLLEKEEKITSLTQSLTECTEDEKRKLAANILTVIKE